MLQALFIFETIDTTNYDIFKVRRYRRNILQWEEQSKECMKRPTVDYQRNNLLCQRADIYRVLFCVEVFGKYEIRKLYLLQNQWEEPISLKMLTCTCVLVSKQFVQSALFNLQGNRSSRDHITGSHYNTILNAYQ